MDKIMKFIETLLGDAYVVELQPFKDKRGQFVRIFCMKDFKKIKHKKEFVQINHSITLKKGTIRGLHYQVKPSSEIKIVRCLKGKVFDVIVDLRKDSFTFLKWFGLELSKDNMQMIYVPEGFAHGFQTLVDNCELLYLHTACYSAVDERGLRYNDTRLGIKWPIKKSIISEKDKKYPLIKEYFEGL